MASFGATMSYAMATSAAAEKRGWRTAAFVAGYVPAIRAVKVDPVVALREG